MARHDDFFGGNLSAQNLNLSQTGRYSSYGKDFVILEDPSYQYHNFEPYKLDKVAVIYCRKGTAEGSVNLIPYQCKAGGMLVILSDHRVHHGPGAGLVIHNIGNAVSACQVNLEGAKVVKKNGRG